jgi:16S rRNA (uracil1498-N3)-methyltransferase
MIPRFYLPQLIKGKEIIITQPAQVHQISRVLRLKPGKVIILFDGSGVEYHTKIKRISSQKIETVLIKQTKPNKESKIKLILNLALLKKNHLEWALQKGTELGVAGFNLLISQRTIVRQLSSTKLRRFQKIIEEAAEQCGAVKIPYLKGPFYFEDLITQSFGANDLKLIASPQAQNYLRSYRFSSSKIIYLIIGPEGGFSPEELKMAQRYDWQPIKLSSRILRAETAALLGASLILFRS